MRPNCYDCIHRRTLSGDAHSKCLNVEANVTATIHGIRQGWFYWPVNFDPTWLLTCDGFIEIPEDLKKGYTGW